MALDVRVLGYCDGCGCDITITIDCHPHIDRLITEDAESIATQDGDAIILGDWSDDR